MFRKMGSDKARCKICQKEYKVKRSNTSTIWRHAEKEHRSKLEEIQKESRAGTQPTLLEVLSKKGETYKKGSPRKDQVDTALINMIAQDSQPLSIVEDKGFLQFCKVMDRKYKVPSRPTVNQVLLPDLFSKTQAKVKTMLEAAEAVSLTSDLWSSSNYSSFIAITCHFWSSKEEKLCSATLDCFRFVGRHTAEQIAHELRRVMEEYNIQSKVLTTVTDNASNIVKAVSALGHRHIRCYAHCLNLIVVDSIKATKGLAEVRDLVSKVVTQTRQSTSTNDKFHQIQRSLGIQNTKKLIQDCPTRWNSFYEMLERFLSLKDAVSLLMIQTGMDNTIGFLGTDQWSVIEAVVKILHPCYEATVELSGEKMATGSKVIPMTRVLMSFYAAAQRQASNAVEAELTSHILGNLNTRFEKVEDIRILAQATLLDPRFKNKCFRHEEKKKTAIACLNKELKELYKDTAREEEPRSPPKKKAVSSIWESFDEEVQRQVPTQLPAISDVDIRNFFSLSCLDRSKDPFQWWKTEGKSRFPKLYKLAVRYLSIPATSVPSERIFSSAGEVISKKRNRISDENARMLICLHSNLQD